MKIIGILNEQKDVLHRLKALLETERDCLIKEDSNQLLEIVEKKTELIEIIHGLEEERMLLYPDLTLTELENMDGIKDEVKKIGTDLRNIVKAIQQDQETNRLLTEQSILYGQKIISIMQNTGKKDPSTYGANGKVGNRRGLNYSKINHSV